MLRLTGQREISPVLFQKPGNFLNRSWQLRFLGYDRAVLNLWTLLFRGILSSPAEARVDVLACSLLSALFIHSVLWLSFAHLDEQPKPGTVLFASDS